MPAGYPAGGGGFVMSMGNFIGERGVRATVMAASTPPAHDASEPSDGVGLDHLTVVPANFEPPADDDRDD
ncbi:hypothetical protein GCM10028856_29140 [Halopiger thermotolerans]